MKTSATDTLLYGSGLTLMLLPWLGIIREPNVSGHWYLITVGAGYFLLATWATDSAIRPAPAPLRLWRATAAILVMAVTTPAATRHFAHRIGGYDDTIAIAFHLATAMVLVLPIIGALRWRNRQTEPMCQYCGYCLRGLSEPRCPECGKPFSDPVANLPDMR